MTENATPASAPGPASEPAAAPPPPAPALTAEPAPPAPAMNAAPALPPADTALMSSIQANEGPLGVALPVADASLIGSMSKGATPVELALRQPAPELPAADPKLVGMAYRSREEPPPERGE